MLSRDKRLRSEKDIMRVLKKGRSVYDKYCGLKFIKNELNNSRFTVVMGTKVSKKAVIRNRVKRQYRALMAERWADLHDLSYDIVLFPGKDAIELSFSEKRDLLNRVFKKSGLC